MAVTDTKQVSYKHNIILIRLSKTQSHQTVNRIEIHLEKPIQQFSASNYNQTQTIPTFRSSQTDGTFLSGQEKINYKNLPKPAPNKLPFYDGDPMAYHDWKTFFQAKFDANHTACDAHRMTYLQDSVSGTQRYSSVVSA